MAPIAVSLGDPAGIGPEITGKTWAGRYDYGLNPFFAVGDPGSIRAIWDGPVEKIESPDEAESVFSRALPLLPVESGEAVTPGQPTPEGARCALDSLELAVGLARSGAALAVVTGPVSKSRLYDIGFSHPGQTEFVAERCGVSRDNIAMMLAGPSLRTIPITTHIPLRDVPDIISIEMIANKARAAARGLIRNFGIASPRLAFAGLNPHAGEFGALGREEIDILEPAIAQLREEGIDAQGPFAADTMFHPAAREKYDVALCLYHDQALIPLKTLHFDEGVNLTLGLPIVRTSPDHGTAFEIAGSNTANPGATIAAISLAAYCAEQRILHEGSIAA
ncbi:4-hydroxythreonine-4-phosphate dehydrogenase PdxA [Parasphingopyxis lamellibrachiae]|uniref:4-hydroxythreonine-4-phosphate dehydrogenase n=1 Tax=Parasphingopyxis lamellibrachiae TaxID=680125 RepID=A0A3D9FDJ5_9SPHN|nr:4-hydroxythreonine-4-phosphate dehydrogenase PdxA [Parasphingopyxis lamellibrachiae]RED15637.1 4-hydroxythreonine-4-phosphate dehydrogenase [Parasphingopyxis lamellibrachiae]